VAEERTHSAPEIRSATARDGAGRHRLQAHRPAQDTGGQDDRTGGACQASGAG
jgi:hypothetical protein